MTGLARRRADRVPGRARRSTAGLARPLSAAPSRAAQRACIARSTAECRLGWATRAAAPAQPPQQGRCSTHTKTELPGPAERSLPGYSLPNYYVAGQPRGLAGRLLYTPGG